MTGLELVFIGLAVLTGASGLLAVTSPRVVHCALWLVVCLGSLSGVYLVLGAEVVALVQLLVYVGAVVVLVIFTLMLTRAPIQASARLDAPPGQRAAAAAAGIALAALLGGTLIYALGDQTVQMQQDQGSAQAVGAAVFGGWVLPFELLSVLLLAALIAALAITRTPGEAEAATRPSGRSSKRAPGGPQTPGDHARSHGVPADAPAGTSSDQGASR